jgi:hypothetical protein
MSIMSYNGKATLALAADKALLADYKEAKQFIDDVITEIKLLAGSTDIPYRHAPGDGQGDVSWKYVSRNFAALFPVSPTPTTADSHER